MKTVEMLTEAANQARYRVYALAKELFTLNQEMKQCGSQMPDFVFESMATRLEQIEEAYSEQESLLDYYEQQLLITKAPR